MPRKNANPKTAASNLLIVSLISLAVLWLAGEATGQVAAMPAHAQQIPVVVKVNGVAIDEKAVLDQMETLYPQNSVHGNIRSEKLKAIRDTAVNELIVEELAYQEAVKRGTVVPLSAAEADYQRMRRKYGAKEFDAAIGRGGLSHQQYLRILQRRMTLEKIYKARVVFPARTTPAQVKTYYEQNKNRYLRPEQVHARLFLAQVSADANADLVKKAQEKAAMVYREAAAGKDFGGLCESYSDDQYRVKGGDLGWVHKGRLEPQFENVAFNLKPGEISPVFRTDYGFSIMKLEAREEPKQLVFEEVQAKIKTQLEQQNSEKLRQALTDRLRKNARIELLDATVTLIQPGQPKPATVPVTAPAMVMPTAAH